MIFTESNIVCCAKAAFDELCDIAKLKSGDIIVIGCSTSEILGEKIGTFSSFDTANAVFTAIYNAATEKGVYIAAQCCEHLNRALIIEKELCEKINAQPVNVVPQPKAGGSFATAAYKSFENPVAIEHIKADAGLDIGCTLIGMHLKEVAVPVRLSVKAIGFAPLSAARTRPKFIGGVRAHYDENLL